jgi:hypothetical protein
MDKQASKWHETRKARLDKLFSGRSYRIVDEKKFDIPQETPLGYKVKTGYIIESIDGEQTFVVGKALINTLVNDYSAIDKPASKKRGRPRKQPIEQAEVWAGRDIPDDAQQITQPGPAMENPNANEHLG